MVSVIHTNKNVKAIAVAEFTSRAFDPTKALKDWYDVTPVVVRLAPDAPAEVQEDKPTTLGGLAQWAFENGLEIMRSVNMGRQPGREWSTKYQLLLGVTA